MKKAVNNFPVCGRQNQFNCSLTFCSHHASKIQKIGSASDTVSTPAELRVINGVMTKMLHATEMNVSL